MNDHRLRIGIAGLGGAGSKMLPWLARSNDNLCDGLILAAAADQRADARQSFEAAYDCPAYASVAELCCAVDVDAVYIATPTPLHCEHTLIALNAGKHVVCEKPLAIRLEDCDRMIDAARRAGVLLLQGHSKVLDAPVQAMCEVIASGRLGRVFQVDTWNYNDWMCRPRLSAELDTAQGGGVVLRQGPQLVDLARILIGTTPREVRAITGRHAPGLDTEGNFSAFIEFEGSAGATISFNGYGHLATGALTTASHSSPVVRRPPRSAPVAAALKYDGSADPLAVPSAPLPGEAAVSGEISVVSCERGILVNSPAGLYLHRDGRGSALRVSNAAGRAASLIELRNALREGRPGFPDGLWGRTTVAVCQAILESSRLGRSVPISPTPTLISSERRP